MKNIKTEADLDIEQIAAMTPGMVGADLANLINEAALPGRPAEEDAGWACRSSKKRWSALSPAWRKRTD